MRDAAEPPCLGKDSALNSDRDGNLLTTPGIEVLGQSELSRLFEADS